MLAVGAQPEASRSSVCGTCGEHWCWVGLCRAVWGGAECCRVVQACRACVKTWCVVQSGLDGLQHAPASCVALAQPVAAAVSLDVHGWQIFKAKFDTNYCCSCGFLRMPPNNLTALQCSR